MTSPSNSDDELNKAYDAYLEGEQHDNFNNLIDVDDNFNDDTFDYLDDYDHLALEESRRQNISNAINPNIAPLPIVPNQDGGSLPSTSGNLFHFRLGSVLDRRSQILGVHEHPRNFQK